jgi:two-component system NtrC family response regulator
VEDLLRSYAQGRGLEQLGDAELDRLLATLREAEAGLLTVMARRGIAPPLFDLKDSEAHAIRAALAQCDGNITEAARALGIARNTLYRKIKEFELAE